MAPDWPHPVGTYVLMRWELVEAQMGDFPLLLGQQGTRHQACDILVLERKRTEFYLHGNVDLISNRL